MLLYTSLACVGFWRMSLSGNTRWKGGKTRILRPPVRGIVHIISADFDTDGCLLTWRATLAKPARMFIFLPGAVTWTKQSSPQNKRTGTWKAHCAKMFTLHPLIFLWGDPPCRQEPGGQAPPDPPLFSFLHPLTRYSSWRNIEMKYLLVYICHYEVKN